MPFGPVLESLSRDVSQDGTTDAATVEGLSCVEARKEATRDGAPPIELVDGEKLVIMFERAGIGLKPRTTYDVDVAFFEELGRSRRTTNFVPRHAHGVRATVGGAASRVRLAARSGDGS